MTLRYFILTTNIPRVMYDKLFMISPLWVQNINQIYFAIQLACCVMLSEMVNTPWVFWDSARIVNRWYGEFWSIDQVRSPKYQGSTYPTARQPGASKTVRRASRFGHFFLLNHIWSGIEKSKFWKSGKWIFQETASPEYTRQKWIMHALFSGYVYSVYSTRINWCIHLLRTLGNRFLIYVCHYKIEIRNFQNHIQWRFHVDTDIYNAAKSGME